jgi:hypothetical protein
MKSTRTSPQVRPDRGAACVWRRSHRGFCRVHVAKEVMSLACPVLADGVSTSPSTAVGPGVDQKTLEWLPPSSGRLSLPAFLRRYDANCTTCGTCIGSRATCKQCGRCRGDVCGQRWTVHRTSRARFYACGTAWPGGLTRLTVEGRASGAGVSSLSGLVPLLQTADGPTATASEGDRSGRRAGQDH